MKTDATDGAGLSKWIGNTQRNFDTIDHRQIKLMQTILANNPASPMLDELPPLWHWLYFPSTVPLDQLGPDGHPKRGGFLPPVDLPRRMWAGGRFKFVNPLKIGDKAEKVSTIKSVIFKKGRTGDLCFVTVVHEYLVAGEARIVEEHDIVYREKAGNDAAALKTVSAPDAHDWSEVIKPDPVMLFRYSALTFNGHKIHYDREYCRQVEGYEGLVFHGPLTATLLIDLAVRNSPERVLGSFEFRAIAPLFDTSAFTIAGRNEDGAAVVWAQGPDGNLAMQARAEFA